MSVRRLPPQPSPFASDTEWAEWHRARRSGLPTWHADRDYVTGHALDRLPRICAHLGCGDAVAVLPRPQWWSSLTPPDEVAVLHGTRGPGIEPVIAVRLERGGHDLLFVDRATGEWECPSLCRRGADLVALAAWRWGLSDTKAAWRLARLCGLWRPAP